MKPARLRKHYKGDTARSYETARSRDPKWAQEQKALAELLALLPEGLKIIDVPVGTGRFLDLYAQKNFSVLGVDVSEDMLEAARTRSGMGMLSLEQGDILALPYPQRAFGLAVCVRFLNLIDGKTLERALRELSRISGGHLIVGVRHLIPPRELRPWQLGGLKVFLRQALSRLRRRIKGKVVVHSQRRLLAVFETLELDIQACRRIERRGDATDYNFYLLKKRPS